MLFSRNQEAPAFLGGSAFTGADNNNVHKVAAQEKKNIIQKLFHH